MRILRITLIVVTVGCSQNSFDGRVGGGEQNKKQSDLEPVTTGNAEVATGEPEENLTLTQSLCQKGLSRVQKNYDDQFDQAFSYLCTDGDVNDIFKNLVNGAYAGGEEQPKVIYLKDESNELYETSLVYAYALKLPIEKPTSFSDFKPHDVLMLEPLAESTSRMVVNVESRTAFPGKGSLEEVALFYDIEKAEGAAIFDQRRTKFNIYQVIEKNPDIVLATEALSEAHPNYDVSRSLVLGIKDETAGYSNFVFLTEQEIRNRIDVNRIKATLSVLNQKVGHTLFNHIANSK
ncbi:hypothetical protein [Pseudobacteriovorax antillogorgiicola]|uniref:Uncharacterized protein n=1 Tax=Pseudobacteriovorax antillogorgiicola TaxID=1513793 RepID=A0A1Y6BER5_9BACT|nr:hypothetical protein [Pseudobacteriovorax antillogorgiicola]TCS56290.1 hypothetical protein EDD56_104112 [Pseudobacteriovorax antillogorgiicola]SMF07517.1 hypothetical protein SAMN06296036_104221 [Pseudobacteriovorax antillogorgiicola]